VAVRLAALMLEHGVEVKLTDDESFLIPTAQPYGRFVDEMMGIQRYPEVHPAPNSGILEPYDVAAWSLPLMMGVQAEKVKLSPAIVFQKGINATPPLTGGLPGKVAYYFINDHQNNGFALINAMQKAGGQVFLLREPANPGDFYTRLIFAAPPQLAAN